MIHYFKAGGLFMWPILLASICGIAVILEKMYYFFKNERDMTESFKKELIKLVRKGDREELLKFCKNKKNSVSITVIKLLENFDLKSLEESDELDYQHLEEIVKEVTLEQITSLEKGMWLLSVVANVSPQLGLLGTVTGMITAFSGLAVAGAGNPTAVAGGISEALYTTAAGLIVAIPALVAYNYYNRKIDYVLMEVEKVTVYLTNDIRNKVQDKKIKLRCCH
ncbi:MAG: MotA/TolQ/ExbB proton channel family protein [Sebaldella sp.]|nr:MotA/TolQ/ExbB proton channel family protein [Sebaldella sp.]